MPYRRRRQDDGIEHSRRLRLIDTSDRECILHCIEVLSNTIGLRGVHHDHGTCDPVSVQIQNAIDHRNSGDGNERLGHATTEAGPQTGGRDDEHG
jgi:hypothetical protein